MARFLPNSKFKTALDQEIYKNQIVDLYLARKSQGEIAKLMGITQPAVSQWIRKITKEWRDVRFKNLDDIKFEELQRINKMESEMWEMWEQSKTKDKKTVINETVGRIEIGQPGEPNKSNPTHYRVQHKATGSEGNMEYWHAIQWCVDRRIKLIGMDAPTKIAPTDPTGTKEFGAGANETLINKLMDMVNNRQEAANRLPITETAEWVPRQLNAEVIETEVTDTGEFAVQEKDDPVAKALKKRALEQFEKQAGEQPDVGT